MPPMMGDPPTAVTAGALLPAAFSLDGMPAASGKALPGGKPPITSKAHVARTSSVPGAMGALSWLTQ